MGKAPPPLDAQICVELLVLGHPRESRSRLAQGCAPQELTLNTLVCTFLRSTVSKEGGVRWQTFNSPRNVLKTWANVRSPNSRDEWGAPVLKHTDQNRRRLAAEPNCLALRSMFWLSNLRASISDKKMSKLLMAPVFSSSP